MIYTSREPQHSRLTQDKAIIKDHHYYKGTEFSWNKPAHVDKKFYPFFHLQNDENKPRIESMKKQEEQDRKFEQKIRKEIILDIKADTKHRFHDRVKERTILETNSNQIARGVNLMNFDFAGEDKTIHDVVAKRVNSSKHLRTTDNQWNFLNRQDKKFVEQAVRPISVKREEEHIEGIKKKIDKEREAEFEKMSRQQEFHDKVRVTLIKKHQKNFDFEDKCGLVPYASSTKNLQAQKNFDFINIRPETRGATNSTTSLLSPKYASVSDADNENNSTEFKLKYSRANLLSAVERKITPATTRLMTPKEPRLPQFTLDITETKGMLIRNMDDNICLNGNAFYETLKNNSEMFKETLESKKKTKRGSGKTLTRPMTSYSKFGSGKSINFANIPTIVTKGNPNKSTDSIAEGAVTGRLDDKDTVFDEISSFEKKFCHGDKKVGYPKVALEEAYRLSTAQGLMQAVELRNKKHEVMAKINN